MPLPDLARHLRPPDPGGTDDAELLRRFADHRDEAAFELLVWRHGGMVRAACRRVLGHSADADDAFQVTFLALARRAGSIRGGAALPGWLHRVARRAAGRVRAASQRAVRTGPLPEPAVEPATPDDVGPVLDEEIDRLPEKLRRAFVLCHLEGVTNEAAAVRLGCPKGTILSRLSRAREQLRDRLTRRGVAYALPLAAAPPAAAVAAGTARAAAAFAAGRAPEIPAHVVTLTHGVLRTMRLIQLRPIALAVALCTLAGGGLALARPAAADLPRPAVPVPAPVARPAPAPAAGPRVLPLVKHDSPQAGALIFSPDGAVLAVSGAKPTGMTIEDVLTLWDAATGKHLHTFRGDDAGGQGLSFSADGRRLVLPVAGAGEVVVREMPGGRELHRLKHPLVSGGGFSPDGKSLVTTSHGFGGNTPFSEVRVWDAETGRKRFVLKHAKDELFEQSDFRADGRLVVQTSHKVLRVIDPLTGKEDPPVRLGGGSVFYSGTAADGKAMLVVVDGRPRLLDVSTGRSVREYGPAGEQFAHAALAPRGGTVHGLTTTGRLRVWDEATGAERGSYQFGTADEKQPRAAFFTPDGRYTLCHWSVPTADGSDIVPWCAVVAADGREVRRVRGVTYVEFDRAMRSVAVVTGGIVRAGNPPPDAVTIHDTAAWLAGGAKGE